jgi:SAM-dependent methyltransferase
VSLIASKPLSKLLRKTTRCLWARQTLQHLEALRRFELAFALQSFPDSGKVLEVGGGTGWQARALQERGFDIASIDLASSNYSDDRVFPVVDYDGHSIPFSDNSFDVVFSSNVMEHIAHIEAFQAEIQRVLKPGGTAIHVIPSAAWRFWTSLSCFVKTWKVPEIHGEHADSLLQEALMFRQQWWQALFEKTGWQVDAIRPCPLFYTGCSIMDARLPVPVREKLSRVLGGSTNLFRLRQSA